MNEELCRDQADNETSEPGAETAEETTEKTAGAEASEESGDDGKTAEDAAGSGDECADEEPDVTGEETESAEEPDAAGTAENGKGKKERKLNWTKKASEAASKKDAEAEKAAAQLAEANDKYARLFAEFDNFRKRTEKEKSAMYDMGARSVIEKILDVQDNFERAMAAVTDEEKESPLGKGMDLIYKQLSQMLDGLGVKPIEAVGQTFDPNLHNAVMHVDDENAGENVVVEEFQKGYTYKDTVIRFSMVKVAN